MLFESVFKDIEAEACIEVFEETAAHIVALVDDDGVFVGQLAEVGEGGTEHRVSRNVVEAALLIKLLETSLHGRDVTKDAILLRQMRDDLTEDVECVFQTDGIDDEVGAESLDFVHRRETLRIVQETHTLRIDVIDSDFVFKTQQVGEEGAHLAGSENEDFHSKLTMNN